MTGDRMDDILTDLSALALARAVQANLYAFFRFFSRSPNLEFSESGATYRWHTPVRHPWFNGVLVSQPPSKDAKRLIAETVAYFQQRDVDVFTWWLEPDLDVSAWEVPLSTRGFHYTADTPGMAVELSALSEPPQPLPNLEIQPVTSQAELRTWATTFGAGYGLDIDTTTAYSGLIASLGVDLPLRYYLGYLNDKPVSASTLFLGAGVAGIYNVGTLPEARGMGIGTQITVKPLLEARQMGYQVGILQSSTMGFNVYRRLGFQHLVDMGHYYWTA